MAEWKNGLFIYPAEESLKKERFNFYDLFPPIGLECIAATIKEKLEKIAVVDLRYEKEEAATFLQDVDFIGISCNWPVQKKSMQELLQLAPKNAFILLGGVYASDYHEELMKENPRIDAVARGDGEEIIFELFEGKKHKDIAGLSYREGGKQFHNPERLNPEILSIYPDRSLRRYEYVMSNPLGMKLGVDTIMTSRGCQFKCEFCTHRMTAEGEERGWSYRTAENVVEEIKQIKAEVILLSDDNFTGDKERVEKICDLLIESGVKKMFIMECRIEIGLNPALLEKLWKVGFRLLLFGIESANDKTLKRIGKGISVAKAKTAFQNINKVPWLTSAFFIVGYIGENRDEMLEIASFARAIHLDFIMISKLRALKNSELYDLVKEMPDYHVDETGRIISDYYTKEEIFQIGREVGRRFYTTRQYLRILMSFLKSRVWSMPVFWKFVFALYYDARQRKGRAQYLRLE